MSVFGAAIVLPLMGAMQETPEQTVKDCQLDNVECLQDTLHAMVDHIPMLHSSNHQERSVE